jgi:hypothetical protein
MAGDAVSVSLRLPEATGARLRRLDTGTFVQAGSDAAAYRQSGAPFTIADGNASIDLPPHGLATIDAELAGA